ncbi:MAG: hypothetical protein ACSHX6_02540 [Akkermansiaceae bacterium]
MDDIEFTGGIFWENYQQRRIRDAEKTADRAEAKVHGSDYVLAQIQRKIDRLALSSQAMWELLRDFSDLTEEDIIAKVLEIDNRDGNTDGKISMQTIDCPTCHRPTNTKRTNCVICGAELQKKHQFEV